MKKKILYLLMAMVLVLSMVGCGGTKSKKTEKAEKEEEKVFEGTTVETNFFSVVYSDDWACDPEENVHNYDDSSSVNLNVPNPETDGYKVRVNIRVAQNIASDFSSSLASWGLNAEDAVKGDNDYDVREIGGVDCWVAELGTNTVYFGYMPDENAFIEVSVDSNEQWDLVDPLLDSIKITAPKWEGDAIPWAWEGTPYSTADCSTTVGSYTVNCKQLPLDEVSPCYEIFKAGVQVVGDDYYVLSDYKLKKFVRKGDALEYDSDIELPFEAENIGVGSDGTVYISAFSEDFTKIQDGTETVIASDTKQVALDPTCTWGVSYFNSAEVAKVNVADGALTNCTASGLSQLSKLVVTDNYIVVNGRKDDEEAKPCLKVYDHDFNELMTLDETTTTTNCYGSVAAVTETANGLMVFDGNMRDVYFIDKNMTLIAAVDMPELMGTDYPWPCQAITLEDGSVIIICTDERADESCNEAVVFQLTGF